LEWWFGQGTGSAGLFEAVLAYEGAGDIPAYGYELRRAGQSFSLAYVDVARENGIVLWAMEIPSGLDAVPDSPAGGKPGTAENLIRIFLEDRGYPLMEIVQEEIHRNPQAGGYSVYTLTPTQDEVLLYPDQIKIQVDLNRMTIIGFEGTSYYQHHRPRTALKRPLELPWTKERIQAAASSLLKITWIRLALIQDDLGDEILTWEVQGRLEDEIFSVFYNSETGAEERVIRRTQPRTHLFSAARR
jgi:germination protein YpeB